jgi:hypothetical protein
MLEVNPTSFSNSAQHPTQVIHHHTKKSDMRIGFQSNVFDHRESLSLQNFGTSSTFTFGTNATSSISSIGINSTSTLGISPSSNFVLSSNVVTSSFELNDSQLSGTGGVLESVPCIDKMIPQIHVNREIDNESSENFSPYGNLIMDLPNITILSLNEVFCKNLSNALVTYKLLQTDKEVSFRSIITRVPLNCELPKTTS